MSQLSFKLLDSTEDGGSTENESGYHTSEARATSGKSVTDGVSSDKEAGVTKSRKTSRLTAEEQRAIELKIADKLPHSPPAQRRTQDTGTQEHSRRSNAPASSATTEEPSTVYYRRVTATVVEGPSPVGIVDVPLSQVFSETVQQKAQSKYPQAWKAVAESKRRSGKWKSYELNFATQLISLFRVGLIKDLRPNTTLRSYIATALNCDPMRVSKKWPKDAALGKQVYKPKIEPNPPFTSIDTELEYAGQQLQDICVKFFERFQADLEESESGNPSYIPVPLNGKRQRSLDFDSSPCLENPASPNDSHSPSSAENHDLYSRNGAPISASFMTAPAQVWPVYQQASHSPSQHVSPHFAVSSSPGGSSEYLNQYPGGTYPLYPSRYYAGVPQQHGNVLPLMSFRQHPGSDRSANDFHFYGARARISTANLQWSKAQQEVSEPSSGLAVGTQPSTPMPTPLFSMTKR